MSTHALDQIATLVPQALVERVTDRGGATWGIIARERIADVVAAAKQQLGFRNFITIDAIDRLHLGDAAGSPRFELAYVLRNVDRNELLQLKVRCGETESVPSVTTLFKGASWAERTVWDFYGVKFEGHQNIRRMFMYEEFQGHPLRKDYPLRGRQPLTSERPIKDIFRGPGANTPAD